MDVASSHQNQRVSILWWRVVLLTAGIGVIPGVAQANSFSLFTLGISFLAMAGLFFLPALLYWFLPALRVRRKDDLVWFVLWATILLPLGFIIGAYIVEPIFDYVGGAVWLLLWYVFPWTLPFLIQRSRNKQAVVS